MEGAYGCAICQKAFFAASSLVKHAEKAHSSKKDRLGFEKNYQAQDFVKSSNFENKQFGNTAENLVNEIDKIQIKKEQEPETMG